MSTPVTVATPHYLLLGRDGPVGPDVVQSGTVTDLFVVYGFSSRQQYDCYNVASRAVLRPYPLVKGHLTNSGDSTGRRITLIAVDPGEPEQAAVRATSAKSLAHALETGSDQVPVEFHLIASVRGGAYQIQPALP